MATVRPMTSATTRAMKPSRSTPGLGPSPTPRPTPSCRALGCPSPSPVPTPPRIRPSGPLGVGWTDSMNVTATASGSGSGSRVTIADENGASRSSTPRTADGHLRRATGNPLDAGGALSGGGWTLTRQNQDVLTFNAAGQLISEVDRNGVGLTLTYNTSDQLTGVTDYAGRSGHLHLQRRRLVGLDRPSRSLAPSPIPTTRRIS